MLGVVALETVLESVGIDLELIERPDFAGLEKLIAPEGVPPIPDPAIRSALAFSAKEAAYKAYYPLRQMPLSFSDMRLKWRSPDGQHFRAVALCPGPLSFGVRCTMIGEWILSAAFSRHSDGSVRGGLPSCC